MLACFSSRTARPQVSKVGMDGEGAPMMQPFHIKQEPADMDQFNMPFMPLDIKQEINPHM